MKSEGLPHPFCVDVREVRLSPGMFSWRVMRKGGPVWRCKVAHDSFESARREAKELLGRLVAEWRGEHRDAEAA